MFSRMGILLDGEYNLHPKIVFEGFSPLSRLSPREKNPRQWTLCRDPHPQVEIDIPRYYKDLLFIIGLLTIRKLLIQLLGVYLVRDKLDELEKSNRTNKLSSNSFGVRDDFELNQLRFGRVFISKPI